MAINDNGHDGIDAHGTCVWCDRNGYSTRGGTVTVDNRDPRADCGESATVEMCVAHARQALDESERFTLRDYAGTRDTLWPVAMHGQVGTAGSLAIDAAGWFALVREGVVFDGAHGQTYNDARLIDLAHTLGWRDDSRYAAARVITDGDSGDYEVDCQTVADAAGDALDYVNEIGHRYGWLFEWHEGDLIAEPAYDDDIDTVEESPEFETETLAVCDCCLSMLANDDDSSCRDYYGHVDGTDDHPHGVCEFAGYPASEGWRVVPGIGERQHAEDCRTFIEGWHGPASEGYECECETVESSRNSCDGCGQPADCGARRTLVTAIRNRQRYTVTL